MNLFAEFQKTVRPFWDEQVVPIPKMSDESADGEDAVEPVYMEEEVGLVN